MWHKELHTSTDPAKGNHRCKQQPKPSGGRSPAKQAPQAKATSQAKVAQGAGPGTAPQRERDPSSPADDSWHQLARAGRAAILPHSQY